VKKHSDVHETKLARTKQRWRIGLSPFVLCLAAVPGAILISETVILLAHMPQTVLPGWGTMHPTTLVMFYVLGGSLILQNLRWERGQPPNSWFLYGTAALLALLILRLADLQGRPIAGTLPLIGGLTDPRHVSLASLIGSGALSIVPLFKLAAWLRAWTVLALCITVFGMAFGQLAQQSIPLKNHVFLELNPGESLVLLCLTALALNVSAARPLLYHPKTPRTNLLMWGLFVTICLRFVLDLNFLTLSTFHLPFFVVSSLLLCFVCERGFRPLELQGIAAALTPHPQSAGSTFQNNDTASKDTASDEAHGPTTELNRNSRLYKMTLEEGPALLLVQDARRLTLNVAPALCDSLGYDRADLLGHDIADLTSPNTRSFVDQMRALGDGVTPPGNKVLEFTTKSGKIRKMTAQRRIIDPNAQGDQPKYVILLTDVTELEAQRSLTETLLNRNAAIVLSQDRDWRLLSVSDAWSAHFGYSREETLGRDLIDFMPAEDQALSKSFRRHLLANTRDKETISNTLTLLTKSGEPRIVELRSVIEENEDRWLNIIMVIDITEISVARQKLEHLVAHDELTGLYSRRGFNSRFADSKRKQDVDVFLIDVDHFKSVNDAYGHETGDELLRKVAGVLKDKTRTHGCASRIGGEEFAIIRTATQGCPNRKFAEDLARAISETAVTTASGPITRTVSIGVARLTQDMRLEDAMKWADWALREAKEGGRNRIVIADEGFSQKLRDDGKLTTHRDIISALEAGEINKYVQPIWDVTRAEIVGFEALMRWQRASGEVVLPRQFLPQLQNVVLAEEYAHIPSRIRRSLLNTLTACPGTYICFNTRLESLGFQGAAQAILREFEPLCELSHSIVLEIGEQAITDRIDMDQVMVEIAILRARGIRVALDDFGKEGSNLNRLTHLPIDIVKIDKSLIDRIVIDRRSREALRSIARLAEALEFEVIAEGVETEAQRDMLLDLGLHLHQGFLYARPMSAEAANALYTTHKYKNQPPQDLISTL